MSDLEVSDNELDNELDNEPEISDDENVDDEEFSSKNKFNPKQNKNTINVAGGDDEEDNDDEDDDEDDEDIYNEDGDINEDYEESEQKEGNNVKHSVFTIDNNIELPDNIEKNDSDYESDEDEDEDDDYLQKLDNEVRDNVIASNHPETQMHNYDEIYKLTKVSRDKNNIIVDVLHKTNPILTKYEKTRILGLRAKQINNGAKPYITIEKNVIDGYLIAVKELEEKKLPFIIRRPMPNGGSEYWKLKDLEII